ncbi:MAG: rRNA maturation RNase YbeY [Ignavibacteria bacterium]|nr:rRNA maturation RNase YbeY [Ignavibacteria bacterium]HEX2962913.1 rRNA maturation RNase YbeY [Ignavibacteriales bacterium]MCU7499943.1 rRNA maturation RNase YbeY [Ignavibacteria bacterium]MCU7513222.1 rRNA maturation RNase YbeY [Ignavibacteria bacterium]MCU7521448.1 rRNA maturation RNase YbeY [Ignavibacteria bacterium]
MIKNLTVVSEGKIKVNKRLLHRLVGLLTEEMELSIVSLPINFLTPETIWNINKQYLGHDYSTDIITFNYSGDNKDLDGEILISVADAADNAKRYECSLDNELLRLVIHGVLHLMGYDDIEIADRKKMKKLENFLTNKFEYLVHNDRLIYDSQNS